MYHLTWTRFEILAVLLGLGVGAVIGGLWCFAPSVLAALPVASDFHNHFSYSLPWTGNLWESIWQQLDSSPLLKTATILLVVLVILRPLSRLFGERS